MSVIWRLLVYWFTFCIFAGPQIPEVDTFDLNFTMFPPKPREERPVTPPTFSEGFFPNHREAKNQTSKKAQPDQERDKVSLKSVGTYK